MNLAGHFRMIGWSGAIAVALFTAAMLADARRPRGEKWFAALLPLVPPVFYGYTAVLATDVLLDRSPATVHRSVVVARYWAGKGGLRREVKTSSGIQAI